MLHFCRIFDKFICLDFGDVAKFCKKNYQCQKCNDKHNILVCTFEKVEEPQNGNGTPESFAKNLNHAESSTLLQTAIAMFSNLSKAVIT